MSRYGVISFLSDFGHSDEFVGVVHSVIASIAPEVRVIDVSHDIAPHDIRAGGLALARAAGYLHPGVVLAVVDPGVGSERRAVAIEVGDGASVLVGPDNGLLAPAVALVGGASRAVELKSSEHRLEALGSTFAGRDVFAPAAAHLCRGVPLAEFGPEIDPASLVPAMIPVARFDDAEICAEVLWVDRYGNCQLNLAPAELAGFGPVVQVVTDDDLRSAEISDSYAGIGSGRLGLIGDSAGLVAIAVNHGSAANELHLREGQEIRLRSLDPEATAAPAAAGSPVASSPSVPVYLGHSPSRPRASRPQAYDQNSGRLRSGHDPR